MNLTRRFAFGSAVIASILGALYLATSMTGTVSRLPGWRAPYRALGAVRRVGTIDASQLAAGPIVALTDDGRDVYVLQNHAWLRIGATGVAGPFGVGARGSAGAILSAADIAVRDSTVYVLDRAARSIHTYAATGRWLNTIRLQPPVATFTPEHIAAPATGFLIVTGFGSDGRSQTHRYVLLLNADGALDTLYVIESELFGVLVPVASTRDRLLVLQSEPYRLTLLQRGAAHHFARTNAERVPLPDSLRRSLSRYLAYLPADRSPFAIPSYLPQALAATETRSGHFVVAEVAAIDSVWIEELDATASPVHTLVTAPIALPVGLTRFGLLTIREDASTTTVLRHSFPD